MSWFRSEEMEYVSIVVQEDAAHHLIDEIGETGTFQFTDLNEKLTPFQRRYASYIRRCDEIERRLRYFETSMQKYNVDIAAAPSWDEIRTSMSKYRERNTTALMEEMENEMEGTENDVRTIEKYRAQLSLDYNRNLEMKHVLAKARDFFNIEASGAGDYFKGAKRDDRDPLAATDVDISLEGGGRSDIAFSYITGTLDQEDVPAFERLIFRSTRGNVFTRFKDIEVPVVDPVTNGELRKSVFIIFYRSNAVEKRLYKICESFGAKRFDVPNLASDRDVGAKMREVSSDIEEAERLLKDNSERISNLLQAFSGNLERYKMLIVKEKAVFHTMNMFKTKGGDGQVIQGKGWVVKSAKDNLSTLVRNREGSDKSIGIVQEVAQKQWPTPPTYFRLNKLTASYQGLVSTYGIPRYREANPALFATATFPFLFGVMYGDIGHALLLFLFAIFLVVKEKELAKGMGELTGMIFAGRYILVGMGFFGLYVGLLYNDYFSIGLNLFGSQWDLPTGEAIYATRKGSTAVTATTPAGTPTTFGRICDSACQEAAVYPFGVDVAWHIAENTLTFTNSLKMKMAIVFGVTQMMGGFFLKLSNALYFKKPLDVAFEAIPQIVMFTALYAYACYLIILKWCIDWPLQMSKGKNPPDLITMLINMVLAPGSIPKQDMLYDNQDKVQMNIIYLCLVCILLLLFPKPIILYFQMKKEAEHHDNHGKSHSGSEDHLMTAPREMLDDDDEGGGHEEHEDFTDVVVHIGIETIEFILGSVSNTASYLRLWALSLAHAQLAEVFLVQFFIPGIKAGPIGAVIGYVVWFGATFGVLLMMDVLECFLHALRLHWVEFQNKFFKADGYEFDPLNFKLLLKFDDLKL